MVEMGWGGIQIPKFGDYLLWRKWLFTWPSRGFPKRTCHFFHQNKMVKSCHKMQINYSSLVIIDFIIFG